MSLLYSDGTINDLSFSSGQKFHVAVSMKTVKFTNSAMQNCLTMDGLSGVMLSVMTSKSFPKRQESSVKCLIERARETHVVIGNVFGGAQLDGIRSATIVIDSNGQTDESF
jgi:hypothetical protein